MIDCSWKDAFDVLSDLFLSSIQQCGARLPIQTASCPRSQCTLKKTGVKSGQTSLSQR